LKRIYAPWRSIYLQREQSGECLFCAIRKSDDDENNRVLQRGDFHFVIINAFPYSNGHVMVVCNRHVEHFSDLTQDESAELASLISRCERILLDAYKPGGINVGANLGRSAGAGIVGHLHVHLVPRWHGDTNFMTAVGDTRVISEDLGETFRKLKSRFE
jgi:ATP adenylyltransferase